jgi:hypothetical protein
VSYRHVTHMIGIPFASGVQAIAEMSMRYRPLELKIITTNDASMAACRGCEVEARMMCVGERPMLLCPTSSSSLFVRSTYVGDIS